MKAIICQPMRGKTTDEIKAVREKATKYLESEGYEVVNTFFDPNEIPEANKHKPLYCLSTSIRAMSFCDAVYFCEGWQDYRGCVLEYIAAGTYGLKIITE